MGRQAEVQNLQPFSIKGTRALQDTASPRLQDWGGMMIQNTYLSLDDTARFEAQLKFVSIPVPKIQVLENLCPRAARRNNIGHVSIVYSHLVHRTL